MVLTFHRVIPNFMIQGTVVLSKWKTGGPGYKIDCRFNLWENPVSMTVVFLSMPSRKEKTGGPQFFICHSRIILLIYDRNHTCFGKVVKV